MMKRHALCSVVLLSGLASSLVSAQSAQGQTTFVYDPPVYQTTYYSPRAVYYPAYRPTFFQAFFGPLAGYYPTYYAPRAYYPVRPRRSYYVPTVVGYAPVVSSPGDCAVCTPCQTSACPSGRCGTAYDSSQSASGTPKTVPVPDAGASKPSAGKPRTYSEQKPPMSGEPSTSPDRAKPSKRAKKTDGPPAGDSPFEPTRPKKKSGDSPPFPGPKTGATGSPRKIEARKLAPPIVIQQRKAKRPPITEPADDESDPFDRNTTKPGATNKNKPKHSGTTSPVKKAAATGTSGSGSVAEARPLHLDSRVIVRTVTHRTRLSVHASRFGTPTVDRAFRSNRLWVPVPSGNRVAGP